MEPQFRTSPQFHTGRRKLTAKNVSHTIVDEVVAARDIGANGTYDIVDSGERASADGAADERRPMPVLLALLRRPMLMPLDDEDEWRPVLVTLALDRRVESTSADADAETSELFWCFQLLRTRTRAKEKEKYCTNTFFNALDIDHQKRDRIHVTVGLL